MKKLDIIFNLPITLMAILLIRLVTNKYQLSSATNILTQSQIDSYRKNGILMMDWQIFPADKLEEISTILINKVIPILIMPFISALQSACPIVFGCWEYFSSQKLEDV